MALALHWSGPQFEIDGCSYPGIPLFLRSESMEIELGPTEFCIHVAVVRGTTRSPKTWKVYGRTMRRFFAYMEEKNLDWKRPGENVEEYLAHYRNSLEDRSRPYVARAMSILCDFYDWASARKFVASAPLTKEQTRQLNRGFLAHLGPAPAKSRSVLIPRVPRKRRFPRYFNHEEQERIYSLLSDRDQLIFDWARYTGARQFEICEQITLSKLPSPASYASRNVVAIPIVGKGGVESDLWVPKWLLDRTFQYVQFFGRREIVAGARSRFSDVPDNVFLSRWGTALKPDSVYRNFKKALQQVGLRGRFHDLRHTYAIATLHRLMQLPRHDGTDGVNALLELRDLMRHASLESTQIYLEARKFYLTHIYADLHELPERYR